MLDLEFMSIKDRKKLYQELKTLKDLVNFAQISALSHRNFYHYTTIETLEAILSNKTLRLTNANFMNDQQELRKGNAQYWDRTYLSCFCYGDSESVAMWTMYSIPWQQGVRISFPRNKFINYLKKIEKIKLINSSKYLHRDEFEVVLTDVIYTEYSERHKSEIIKIDEFPNINSSIVFGDDNISRQSQITGFIKNKAWEYENETRIKIQTNKEYTDKTIEVELDEDLLSSMKVTFSPWSRDYQASEIKMKFPYLLTSLSKLNGLVKIISKCRNCDADYSENGYRV